MKRRKSKASPLKLDLELPAMNKQRATRNAKRKTRNLELNLEP